MNEIKNQRANELIMRKASDFIQRESNGQSLITVTNSSTSGDNKRMIIYVTVLPEQKEKAVIDFLKRNRSEFKQYIRENTRLNIIPHFDFEIDFGEKSRQRVDELL